MATTAVAAIWFQYTPVDAKKLIVPTGSVVVLCLVSTSGKMTLFQLKTKANIDVTMIPGKASGSVMWRNDWKRVPPSTRAASSNSTGTSSIKLLSSHTENGIVIVCSSTMTDWY